jgi:hypothetical protein
MAEEAQSIPGSEIGSELPKQNAAVGVAGSGTEPASGDNGKLAGILAKQARGEKLTRSETGFLGGIRNRKPAAAAGPAGPPAPANPLLSVPVNPANPLLAPPASGAEPVPGVPAPAYDSSLLRETADGICGAADTITKRIVGWYAEYNGGDRVTVEQYEKAVALHDGNRRLIVEGSEPAVTALCEALKCPPEKLNKIVRSSGLVAGLGAHLLAVSAALKQIREDKMEREKNKPAMTAEVKP